MHQLKQIALTVLFLTLAAALSSQPVFPYRQVGPENIHTGAQRTEKYYPDIREKAVAIVANHSSLIRGKHLVDSLLSAGFNIVKVFSPEHGFRGSAAAGATIKDGVDAKTGIPIVSLYGEKKMPSAADLDGIDVVLFDIQDVGVRFYTYVSTMTYVMQVCAENKIPFIILDRPNPNGHYVDGPVLDPAFQSFVGLHPVPVVHGMTLGEYAMMVNGEKWLDGDIQCNLKVVPLNFYTHTNLYQLPVKPSPNLPNMASVYLYPSLAFFEGTSVSVARGTDFPFQAFGHPELENTPFSFTPEPRPEAPHPPQEGKLCQGYDLREFGERFMRNYRQLYIFWLIETYRDLGGKPEFFNSYFDKLAGTDKLRNQIILGLNEEQIRESWEADLEAFKKIRKKYVIYPDFE